MKITGKVVSNRANAKGCAFIAVQDSHSQDKTMFVSETSNSLFCGQELSEGCSATLTALEEQSFKHRNTTYYRPLKVVVNSSTPASSVEPSKAKQAPNKQLEGTSSTSNTNTKQGVDEANKSTPSSSSKHTPSSKPARKPHVLQRKVYGRVLRLSFSDKTATLTVIDNHNETGEVLDVTFRAIPRDLEDGMRISCNVESSTVEGCDTSDTTVSHTIKATHRTYEDERKGLEEKMVKIIYGNARNVAASAVGAKDVVKLEKLAMEIYEKGKIKRAELKEEFPDMDDFDLGAKWGDSMKQAGCEYKTSAKIIELAEVLFRSHVEIEKRLV